MKVTVTHLKAPWPVGAAIGSIVEVPGDAIPAWAVGKCTEAAADAEAAFAWTPPVVAEVEPPKPVLPPGVAEAIAEATAPLQAKIAEQAATIEQLQKASQAGAGELTVNPGGAAAAGEGAARAAGGEGAASGAKATRGRAGGAAAAG